LYIVAWPNTNFFGYINATELIVYIFFICTIQTICNIVAICNNVQLSLAASFWGICLLSFFND